MQHRQEAAISAGGSSKLCRSGLEQQWLTASECSTAALVAVCLQRTAHTVQALLPRPPFRPQLCWSCRPAAPQRTRRSSAPSTGSAAAELMLLEAGDRAATLAVHRAGACPGGQQLFAPLSVRCSGQMYVQENGQHVQHCGCVIGSKGSLSRLLSHKHACGHCHLLTAALDLARWPAGCIWQLTM